MTQSPFLSSSWNAGFGLSVISAEAQAAVGVGIEVVEARDFEQPVAAGERGELLAGEKPVAVGVGVAEEAGHILLPLIAGDVAVLVEVPGDGGEGELALDRRRGGERPRVAGGTGRERGSGQQQREPSAPASRTEPVRHCRCPSPRPRVGTRIA